MTSKPWLVGRGHDESAAAEVVPQGYGPRRFWMASGKETSIIFLHDEPVRIYEHQVAVFDPIKKKRDFRNWATCADPEGRLGTCQLCGAGDQPYYAGVWAVVDRSEWESKKDPGKMVKDQLRLFVAKAEVLGRLSRLAAKLKKQGLTNGLAGIEVEVSRGGPKSPNTGDTFNPVGKRFGMLKEYEIPDFETILAPDPRKVQRLLRSLTNSGPAGDGRDTPVVFDSDDVPF